MQGKSVSGKIIRNMALLQECPRTLVESGQNFPEHLDLGSPGKRWQTI